MRLFLTFPNQGADICRDLDRRAWIYLRFGLALTVALALGCTASKVSTSDPSASAFAPTNEVEATAEISYCNAGAKSVKNARREDAYKKMHQTCGGRYEIVQEEDQKAALCKSQRRIWFRCLDGEEDS